MGTCLGMHNKVEGRIAFLGGKVIENVGANHFPISKGEPLKGDAEHSSDSTIGTVSPQHILGLYQDLWCVDAPGKGQQLDGLGLR